MHKLSIEGSGVVKLEADGHGYSINDALFILDLNPNYWDVIKAALEKEKWGTVTVLQVEIFDTTTDEFKEAIGTLIDYAIFHNQHYCDKIFLMTTQEDYTNAANEVWPEHKKPITKFRGREWPTDTFVKEFIPLQGIGTVSPAVEHIDMNDLVSWHWDLNHSTGNVTETYDFTPPTEENLPKPLTHGVPFPEIPDPPEDTESSGGASASLGGEETAVEYEIHYTYYHEWTDMPVSENHTKPMGNFTAAVEIPQNTLHVDVYKLVDCTCTIKEPEEDDSGGGD